MPHCPQALAASSRKPSLLTCPYKTDLCVCDLKARIVSKTERTMLPLIPVTETRKELVDRCWRGKKRPVQKPKED